MLLRQGLMKNVLYNKTLCAPLGRNFDGRLSYNLAWSHDNRPQGAFTIICYIQPTDVC